MEVHWCVEQLLSFAADDPDRWCALVELRGDVDDKQFNGILDRYESRLAEGAFDQEGKRQLWETVNVLLVRMEWSASRRRLSNGKVVDKNELEDSDVENEPHFPGELQRYAIHGPRLRQLLDASTPDDPVLAGCHAFLNGFGNNHCTRHFFNSFDYEKRQERIGEARKSIAESVWRAEGLDGLRRLAAIEHVDAYGSAEQRR
jgi:hypothetical protein